MLMNNDNKWEQEVMIVYLSWCVQVKVPAAPPVGFCDLAMQRTSVMEVLGTSDFAQ